MIAGKIRKYKPRDSSSIISLFSELQLAEHEAEPNRRTGLTAAKSYFNKISKQLKKKKGRLFVVKHDNSILGFVLLLIEKNDTIENKDKHVYISDIVTKKEYYRMGIGEELIKKAKGFASKKGITEIRVNSLIRNIAALNLYHKAGFHDKEILLTKTILLL